MRKYLLNSVALFAPNEDIKSKSDLAKEEREKIDVKVTSVTGDEEEEVENENEEKIEAKQDADNKTTDEEQIEESDDKTSETDDKEVEDKKEVKTKTKEDRRQERMQRRIDKATAEAKAARAEAEELKRQLALKPDDEKVLTEDEVEKRSEVKAAQKAAERAFVADCNKLAEEAEKLDKNFNKKIDVLTEDIGPIPSQMIGILSDLDNGAKVLVHLTENEDDAEEIWKLPLAKMAVKLFKLSEQLNKKPKKEISKVPEPNKPIGGKGGQNDVLHDKLDMADWVKLRNKQVAERNAAKRNSMR